MKTLTFNTKKISFTNKGESNRPDGIIINDTNDSDMVYNDIAVTFICIEDGDDQKDADKIVGEIIKYSKMVGRPILLTPFVHLSSFPAKAENALLLLKRICAELKSLNILVNCASFGFHKTLIAEWVTLAHKGDVAFRDSSFIKSGEKNEEQAYIN